MKVINESVLLYYYMYVRNINIQCIWRYDIISDIFTVK